MENKLENLKFLELQATHLASVVAKASAEIQKARPVMEPHPDPVLESQRRSAFVRQVQALLAQYSSDLQYSAAVLQKQRKDLKHSYANAQDKHADQISIEQVGPQVVQVKPVELATVSDDFARQADQVALDHSLAIKQLTKQAAQQLLSLADIL